MRPAVKNAVIADQYRASLYHLCKYGLGMKDVTWGCHGGMIAGLEAPTKRKLSVMPRGSLKCHHPMSLITLPDGTQRPAIDLNPGDIVKTWSKAGFSQNRILAKQINLEQDMFEITLRSGKVIKISDNHPVLTIEGFKEAKELKISTRVGSWAGTMIDGPKHFSHEEMFLLGAFIGDGSVTGGNASMVLHHEHLREEVLRCASELGFKSKKDPSCMTYYFSSGVRPWLRAWGLENKGSHTKTVPPILFEATLAAKRSFIAGYLSCDGCFSKKSGKMNFITVSTELASQMRQLLLSIGVYSKAKWFEYDYGAIKPRGFYGSIVDPISMKNLLLCPFKVKTNEGFVPPQDGFWRSVPKDWRKVDKPYRARALGFRIDNNYDTSYTKFKKFSDEIGLSWACRDDIVWDEVVSMIPYKGQSVDFEIENDHTFLVDGIITHNSSVGVVGYAIWILINDPNARILIDSEVYVNSSNFLREIKAHLESPRLTDIFGKFRSNPWSEGELTIAQRTHPYKEASITCGGVGTGKTGQHFGYILYDDLNGSKNSGTTEARAKVYTHYRMGVSLLEPDGTVSITGTRYSDDDVIGLVLKNLGIK